MKKNKAALSFALVLLAGTALWLCRRTLDQPPARKGPVLATKQVEPAPQPQRQQEPEIDHLSPEPPANEEAERVRHFVAEAKALLEQLDHLSTGNVDQLRKIAELTNDFGNGLDEEKAALLVKNMPAGFVSTGLGDLTLRFWAKTNRAAAAEWMAAHPSDSPIPAAAVAQGWLEEDRDGFMAYADALPPSWWKYNLLKAAGEDALVIGAPEDAIALLGKIQGQDARRDEIQQWAMTSWAIKDPHAAIQSAGLTGDYALRQKLLAAAAIGMANSEPEKAAGWLLQYVTDPEAQRPAIAAVVRLWAAKTPENVAQWVAQFPAGKTRQEALEGLLEVWAATGTDAEQKAQQWQASLSDPALRQAAQETLQTLRARQSGTGGMARNAMR